MQVFLAKHSANYSELTVIKVSGKCVVTLLTKCLSYFPPDRNTLLMVAHLSQCSVGSCYIPTIYKTLHLLCGSLNCLSKGLLL